jgi:hypothetical protein
MGSSATVVFENDQVRVSRVRKGGPGTVSTMSRYNRLIIYLRDGHIGRTESGHREELRRKAGDVVWRERSRHVVETLDDVDHEVLIVEIKSAPGTVKLEARSVLRPAHESGVPEVK